MKILATVSYKGTNYQGWQKQTNAPSIQEEIEKVISKILNVETTIYGAGRTDTGVHAKNQTFHFVTDKEIDLDKLRYSINCLLPKDIHINSLEEVGEEFHARYSATGKHYTYTIVVGENNPFDNEFVLTYLKDFDVKAFIKAFEPFNGEHNFQDFTSKEEDEDGFRRTVSISSEVIDNRIVIHFIGNGFMRYMIRFMVGAAIAVAEKRVDENYIPSHLLDNKAREIIAYKAPGEGLVLESVLYK